MTSALEASLIKNGSSAEGGRGWPPMVQDVSTSGEDAPAGRSQADLLGLVVFSVGDARFALDVANVIEVVAPLLVTPLFEVPAHVMGVMNLRGRVLPVSRLATLLGRAQEDHARLTNGEHAGVERSGLRVRFRDEEAVFAIDRVIAVTWIDAIRLENAPSASRELADAFFLGILPDDPPVTCISTERIFDLARWCAASDSQVREENEE